MRLFLVVVAALVVASSSCVLGAEKINPGDLKFDVVIDATPQTSTIEAKAIRNITFKLEKTTSKNVSGKIVLHYPESVDSTNKSVQSFEFDMGRSKSLSIPAKLELPKNTPLGQLSFPIEVYVGKEKYLSMNLLVTKAIAWSYIGPFEGGLETAHNKIFPPEKGIELNATYKGAGGKVIGWKPFPLSAINSDGMFEFHNIFGELEETTAYATTNVYVDQDTKAVLSLGSDDSIKVWQNGKLVHDHKIARGSGRGQDKANITLVKGKNEFLIKNCQLDGGWGFHFDIQKEDGNPLQGLKYDLVVCRSFITDPILRLTSVTKDTAAISWQSDVPTQSKVIVRKADPKRATPVYGNIPKSAMVKPLPGAREMVFKDDSYSTEHKISIKGLEPGTRYLVSVTPAIGGKESEPLAFYTAPPDGKTMYLKLKIVNLIFTNVTPKADSNRPGADNPVSQEMVDRIKRECEQAAMFYWINSGMRFCLENEYFVYDKHIVVSDDSYYGVGYDVGNPDERLLREVLAAHGKKPTDYDGRIFISCEKRYDENAGEWWYPSSGGGTIGPESEPGIFKCAWKAGSPNAWMYTHEGGHGFDSLYHWSMGPEFLFNHPQPWDGTAHRTGDHYDANAYILWDWAGYVNDQHQCRPFLESTKRPRYFACRWGVVHIADDKDNDGIPDNDPNVPLDEKRWGSNPNKKDTDGDGLDDLQEAMACEWVDQGNCEIWAGPIEKHRCNPNNPDTDGDGIIDGKDPYPIYAVDPKIKIRTPKLDGVISAGEYAPFASLDDDEYKMDFFLAWDKDNLYIAGKSDVAPYEVKVLLDLDDNGWYLGHDNYHLVVHPSGGRIADDWHPNTDKTFGAIFHNCGVPNKWPFYDPNGLKPGEIKFAHSKNDGYSFEIAVPKNVANGLKLEPGELIGIVIGVEPVARFKRAEMHGPLTLFEPHTRFTFELVEK